MISEFVYMQTFVPAFYIYEMQPPSIYPKYPHLHNFTSITLITQCDPNYPSNILITQSNPQFTSGNT